MKSENSNKFWYMWNIFWAIACLCSGIVMTALFWKSGFTKIAEIVVVTATAGFVLIHTAQNYRKEGEQK